jgi:hypothetical protein
LTNNKKHDIINVSKEREVTIMTRLTYMVNGVEVPNYAEALRLGKATGAELVPRYTTIEERPEVDLELVARRMAAIRNKAKAKTK